MNYQKSANEIAQEYERREKAAERGEPVNASVPRPKAGTFSAWIDAESMLNGNTADFVAQDVLIQVAEGVLIVTDEDGDLEFYPTTAFGYACYVRNRDEG